MWDHVECIEEAAVVENAPVHIVGRRVVLTPTESQGHGGSGALSGGNAEEKRWRKRRRKRGRPETEERRGEFKADAFRACCLFKGNTASSDPANSQRDLLSF